MKYIKLTRNKKALVDNENFEYLNQWKWHCTNTGYAYRWKNSKQQIGMHGLIMNTPKGMDTDHINGNPLDNRKLNLRICTRKENSQNQRKSLNKTSVYKGVYPYYYDRTRWYSQIGKKYLGVFNREIDAAKAYDKAAKIFYKQFAKLNFS